MSRSQGTNTEMSAAFPRELNDVKCPQDEAANTLVLLPVHSSCLVLARLHPGLKIGTA